MEGSALPGNKGYVTCAQKSLTTAAIATPSQLLRKQENMEALFMGKLIFALFVSSSFLLAQDGSTAKQDNSNDSKSPVTMQGCVSRSSGDYVLMKQDPAETFELQATSKIKLKHYLGQRVEVTGTKSASMSTSSDAIARMGSPSPETLTISSIKVLDKNCSERPVTR